MSARVNLLGLPRPALEAWCESLGSKPFRARQLMSWLYKRGVSEFEQMTDLARDFRAQLALQAEVTLPEIITSQQAGDEFFPSYAAQMTHIGRERGWPPTTRAQFDASRTLRGANFVGGPDQVIEKILFQHELFRHDRFLIQFSVGALPHKGLMHSIELFGTKVAPAVRTALGKERAVAPAGV